MMNSESLTSSSASASTLAAAEPIGFRHAGPVADRLGLEALAPVSAIDEETLVVDVRSSLSPAQMVESKLSRKLQETSLPVSHLQMRVLLRGR